MTVLALMALYLVLAVAVGAVRTELQHTRPEAAGNMPFESVSATKPGAST
jgi:hypothetical protein